MLTVCFSKKFQKEYKKVEKNVKLFSKLQKIITILAQNKTLDKKHHNHKLKGDYKNYQECHITPDLLLIYKIDKNKLTLYLFKLGKHSKLFK